MPRWLSLSLILALALLGAGAPMPSAAAQPAACVTFPETGKQVCDRFLEYWQVNGGLAQQGLPLIDAGYEISPTNGKPYWVQYFERARFELHPENAAPYDVLLGLLGREQLQAKYPQGAPAGVPAGTGCDPQAVPPGTKCINREFGQYYLGHGGLAQQGYALTDAFDEVSPTNGQTYLVQYFERARFEYHPENAGTPYVILLGLLGREQFQAKYPNGLPPVPPDIINPLPSPPAPSPSPSPSPRANCDPSYPTVCIPPPPPDLDCSQIPYKNFPVKQPDPHRFDSDKDGIGCES